MLTQKQQDVVQLSGQHAAVLQFVVDLQSFHQVLECADVLILFDLREDWKEF